MQNFINVIKGLGIAIIITIIGLAIFSALLAYTDISENIMNSTIIAITALSIFIASLIVEFKISNKGIIIGGCIGGTYIVIIYLISSIITNNFGLKMDSILLIVFGILSGIVGGIVGANIKHSRKK